MTDGLTSVRSMRVVPLRMMPNYTARQASASARIDLSLSAAYGERRSSAG
jgi:hypothetical protein